MTPAQITEELHALADLMGELAEKMQYFGGFGENGQRGRELYQLAAHVSGWCVEDWLKNGENQAGDKSSHSCTQSSE